MFLRMVLEKIRACKSQREVFELSQELMSFFDTDKLPKPVEDLVFYHCPFWKFEFDELRYGIIDDRNEDMLVRLHEPLDEDGSDSYKRYGIFFYSFRYYDVYRKYFKIVWTPYVGPIYLDLIVSPYALKGFEFRKKLYEFTTKREFFVDFNEKVNGQFFRDLEEFGFSSGLNDMNESIIEKFALKIFKRNLLAKD